MGDTTEAAVARKTCPKCRAEQDIDQFYDARGNGKIVINCLSCRNKQKLHVDASRASTRAYHAITRGENHAPPLAPESGPRRNLTHSVLAAMFRERGRVATDTSEMAAARDQRLAIQRRHRVERRHGEQPSQTPPLSGLLRRQQLRNAEDEAPMISQGNLLPVQVPEEDLEGDADGFQHIPPQIPRRGRPPKRRSPSPSLPRSRGRPRGRPRLARNPVGRPRKQSLPEENPLREFDEPGPRFTGNDQEAPLSAEDTTIKREFDEALAAEEMQRCLRCKERWFDVKLMLDGVCKRCHDKDDKKRQDEPFFLRREQA
ncbi:hypothetical protein C8A05DRAFT_12930 [Staphylotrichum tortipilum]|uniref:Uncharacterized protein n=1 Tax=Staphylotrichum tortipilum TaxID=2831512 RepID=A0AAN6MQI9_9PEZI|nr:hypothetical protein C8A05DRAFT_12930 [Staphylotrichum longicolle]